MRPVAYLVSDFEAPSHTFIRREVAGLRALGVEVILYSVKRNDHAEGVASLLGRGPLHYAAALLWGILTGPLRLSMTWWLASTHREQGLRGLVWSQFHFVEAIALARMMSAAGVGRLHNHFANSGATVGLIAAHFGQIPWSVTLHGISETDHPAGRLLRGKIERADFVACASYFMQAQAMRMVPEIHWGKCHIVRCGVDLSAMPRQRVEASTTRAPQLICVGRLSPEKGYPGLLLALSRLASEGREFALTIVGDGPSSDDLRERVEQLGLAGRVRFVGALSERATLDHIAAADLLIVASLMEGLPVVLIEALALAKPVLASRVAGIPELIEDGRSGLLFAPSDWHELECKLRQLLLDSASWEGMGRAGRARIAPEFETETTAARMAALLQGDTPV